jgi:hypothetical protein
MRIGLPAVWPTLEHAHQTAGGDVCLQRHYTGQLQRCNSADRGSAMTVRSEELKPSPPTSQPASQAPRRPDWSLLLGKAGLWLMLVAFGGIIWAINGGFSVLGLGVVASSFNDAGRLFWALATSWTFHVPVNAPGLPTDQPVLPWAGVVAATFVQVAVISRKLAHKPVPPWLWGAAGALSLYDFGTTFAGLGTVVWLQQAGVLIRGALTLVLTFALETAVSIALRRR